MIDNANNVDLDGVAGILRDAARVLPCHLYHATKKYTLFSLDTAGVQYRKHGAVRNQMENNAQNQLVPVTVLGSPLTLVPALNGLWQDEITQVNFLKHQLCEYLLLFQKYSKLVQARRYLWTTSWAGLLKQLKLAMMEAPILHEQRVVNRNGAFDFVKMRHTVFVPISNNGIGEMLAHGTNGGRYFRMGVTGTYDEILRRNYDAEYHQGLLGGRYDFPVVRGNAGQWNRVNSSGQVNITGNWTCEPENAWIICIKRLDREKRVLNDDMAFGVLAMQYDMKLTMCAGSRLRHQ